MHPLLGVLRAHRHEQVQSWKEVLGTKWAGRGKKTLKVKRGAGREGS